MKEGRIAGTLDPSMHDMLLTAYAPHAIMPDE